MEQTKTISVLIEREDDWWVAQCVEHDLVTQARTLDELHLEIYRMLVAHICACEEEGIEPFQVPPAPPEVRERFARARTAITALGAQPQDAPTRHRLPTPDSRIAA